MKGVRSHMRILLLADIHIGSIIDTNYVYSTITSIFDKELLEHHTDAVVILGDYFDRLFKANEDYVALSVNVMSYLVRLCRKNHTKLRMIYGTDSHEMNQYRLFNYFLSSRSVDIKLITTATEEELFDGVNVLYLPEEYMKDKHEFYKNTIYSGKHYNYIFGHGTIIEGMPNFQAVLKQEFDNNNEAKVPKFKIQELSPIADIVAFGHIHIPYDNGNIHYIGSLFRDSFGEEQPKRYGIIENNEISFVENTKAYIYDTFEYNEDSDIYLSSDNILKHINEIRQNYQELISGEKEGKIRLIFHPPVDVDPTFYTNLKDILFNDKLFKTLIKETSKITVTEDDVIEDEWEFVLDKTLKPDDKIYMMIDKLHEDHMTMQELIDYIHNPISF